VERIQQAIELDMVQLDTHMVQLDTHTVQLDTRDRNEMKNAIGFVNHFFNMVEFQSDETELGLLSPLIALPWSQTLLEAATKYSFLLYQRHHWVNNIALIKRLSEVLWNWKKASVIKRDNEYLNKSNDRQEVMHADLSSIIMRNKNKCTMLFFAQLSYDSLGYYFKCRGVYNGEEKVHRRLSAVSRSLEANFQEVFHCHLAHIFTYLMMMCWERRYQL